MAAKSNMYYEAPFVGVMTMASEMLVQAVADAVSGIETLGETVIGSLSAWQTRVEQRRHLLEVDEHVLNDIGLTRGEAADEAHKPFWRA